MVATQYVTWTRECLNECVNDRCAGVSSDLRAFCFRGPCVLLHQTTEHKASDTSAASWPSSPVTPTCKTWRCPSFPHLIFIFACLLPVFQMTQSLNSHSLQG